MKKLNIILALSMLATYVSFGQQYNWVNHFGEVGNSTVQKGTSVLTDANGDIFNIGEFSGTVDFDPGTGVFNLTTPTNNAYAYIAKYSSNGDLIWAKMLTWNLINKFVIDASNNLVLIGNFSGTVDFDPGPATYNLTSSFGGNVFMQKLDISGNFLSAMMLTGGGAAIPNSLCFDNIGNIIIAGQYTGTIDLDPGTGTASYTSAGSEDMFISKLSSSGTFIWGKSIGSVNSQKAFEVAIDNSNNVYAIGEYQNSGGSPRIYLCAYSSAGAVIWSKMSQNSPSSGVGVKVNSNNEIVTVGTFYTNTDIGLNGLQSTLSQGGPDIYISKYNIGGTLIWAKSIGGGGSESCEDLFLDANSNYYISGRYDGSMDFDPSTTNYIQAGNGNDGFIAKYDINGNFIYVKTIGAPGTSYETCNATCVSDDKVISTGFFSNVTDFDPGAGVYNLTSFGNLDAFLFSSCDYQIIPSSNTPVCLDQNLDLTTNSILNSSYTWSGPNNFLSNFQNPTISNISSAGAGTYLVNVNNGCSASESITISINPTPIVTPVSNGPICQGQTLEIYTNTYPGATYNWTGPNNYTGITSNVWITNATDLATGIYTITLTDANGCMDSSSVYYEVKPLPTISISATSNSICNGSFVTLTASGANTYSWNGGVVNGMSFYPTTTQTYSVIGTAINGCSNTATKTIIVNPTPTATISSTNNTKCSGACNGTASVVASGGTPPYSYLWPLAGNNQTSASATNLCLGSYTVNISDNNGCAVQKNTTVGIATVTDANIFLTNLAAIDQINVSPSFAAYYTYNLPASITPPASNPRNFVDPGKKARFKIECTNQKSNGQSIVSGICKVRTNSSYITITDTSSALNNIGWNDKAWSADEFEIDIDPNTPAGTNAYIDFIVQEGGQEYTTSCIAIPITPLVYSPTTPLTIDDDNNPDSQGNDNEICEPNEIIEFYPWLDNISTLNAEYVRGRFENLDNHSFVNIWNGVPGVGTTVYDATWWNYSFAQPQIINASSLNTTPEYDFVFDYGSTGIINDFKLYMVMGGGFKLFSGNALSLVQWTLPYTFNSTGGPVSVDENSQLLDQFILYPNPTTNLLSIKTNLDNSNNTYSILNSIGQVVLIGKLNSEISTIDVNSLESGVYTILFNDEINKSYKLIKQ